MNLDALLPYFNALTLGGVATTNPARLLLDTAYQQLLADFSVVAGGPFDPRDRRLIDRSLEIFADKICTPWRAAATAAEQNLVVANASHVKELENVEKDLANIKALNENAVANIEMLNEKALEAANTKVEFSKRALALREADVLFYRQRITELEDRRVAEIHGSVTRARRWREIVEEGLVKFVGPPSVDFSEVAGLAALLETAYKNVEEMYEPVHNVLRKMLDVRRSPGRQGARVFDTHNDYYLSGHAPDISICVDGITKADQSSVYAVIDLKDPSKPLESDAFGQIYDYLLFLRRAQPLRQSIVAVMSNLRDNYIVTMSPSRQVTRCSPIPLSHMVAFLRKRVLVEEEFSPGYPSFSEDLGDVQKRLGNTRTCAVAEFATPPNFRAERKYAKNREIVGASTDPVPPRIVVKRVLYPCPSSKLSVVSDIPNEIRTLKKLKGGCDALPQMLFYSTKLDEFAIFPVGEPINPAIDAHKQTEITTVLDDVLSALEFMHQKELVHRDVRWDNVVLVGERSKRGMLIDFGTATAAGYEVSEYLGGYLCCPRSQIGNFDKPYTPRPADDYLAFLLMVNAALFPLSWRSYDTKGIEHAYSDASGRLLAFWDRIAASPFWGPFYTAARSEEPNLAKLRELKNLFVVP